MDSKGARASARPKAGADHDVGAGAKVKHQPEEPGLAFVEISEAL